MHNIFFPKRAIFLVKGAQFLTPQTIFIAFSYMNFLEMPNLKKKSKIFYFFWVFFYIFPFKGLFYHFTKAHKNFSRSHLTLKVAPMCSKAHTINHSLFVTAMFIIIDFQNIIFIFSDLCLQKCLCCNSYQWCTF